jgi:hypothetical protein
MAYISHNFEKCHNKKKNKFCLTLLENIQMLLAQQTLIQSSQTALCN